MKRYEPHCGSTITRATQDMVKMANESGAKVVADFNDIEITANPGDDAKTIEQYYFAESKKRHEEYINSPEYKEAQKQAKEAQRREDLILEGALSAAPEKMTLKDEQAWKETVEANTDGYGGGVVSYAERWARLMEGKMAHGATLEECAKEASHIADNEGITGFMYGCAVSILTQVWIHGEQLRRWHNLDSQLGTEGEEANESGGVLNPALLTLSTEG